MSYKAAINVPAVGAPGIPVGVVLMGIEDIVVVVVPLQGICIQALVDSGLRRASHLPWFSTRE